MSVYYSNPSKHIKFKFKHFGCLLIILLYGCGDAKYLTQELEGSREATFSFWARLQTIQYENNPKIVADAQQLFQALKSDQPSVSVEQFRSLANKHESVIQQLERIDKTDVDSLTVEYRDRLVSAHKELVAEWQESARLVEAEDWVTLSNREKRQTTLRGYVDTWNDRYTTMAALKEKFNREYDVVE